MDQSGCWAGTSRRAARRLTFTFCNQAGGSPGDLAGPSNNAIPGPRTHLLFQPHMHLPWGPWAAGPGTHIPGPQVGGGGSGLPTFHTFLPKVRCLFCTGSSMSLPATVHAEWEEGRGGHSQQILRLQSKQPEERGTAPATEPSSAKKRNYQALCWPLCDKGLRAKPSLTRS